MGEEVLGFNLFPTYRLRIAYLDEIEDAEKYV
jgi:hypothetical protein